MAMALEERTEMAKEIGQNLRAARKAAELSEERAAALAGVTRMTVRRIEAGETVPGIETVISLARVLGIRPVDLLGSRMGLYLSRLDALVA